MPQKMGCYIHGLKTVESLKDNSANSRSTTSNFNDLFLLENTTRQSWIFLRTISKHNARWIREENSAPGALLLPNPSIYRPWAEDYLNNSDLQEQITQKGGKRLRCGQVLCGVFSKEENVACWTLKHRTKCSECIKIISIWILGRHVWQRFAT